MAGWERWLGLLCLLSFGCGQTTADHASSSTDERVEPPGVAPRWTALVTRERLLVVRFDDVTQPETVELSSAANGERVDEGQVFWSPTGAHVAFLTGVPSDVDGRGPRSLWVASAGDGFARRAVEVPAAAVEDWGPSTAMRGLFWIGSDTFALRLPTADGIEFYRTSVGALLPESLGLFGDEPDGDAWSNVVSAASPSGFLFSTGSRSNPKLYLAEEQGPPRLLGSALVASGDGEHYASAELLWAPDGKRADFWTTATGEEPGVAPYSQSQYGISDAEAPVLTPEPEAALAVGLVHMPRNLIVDADPHGSVTFTEEVGGRALAPEGGSVAFSLHHEAKAESYRLLARIPNETTSSFDALQIDGGLGKSFPPSFGFLDKTSLFYPKFVPGPSPDAEPSARCVLWQAGQERELSVARYAPDEFRSIPGTQLLYFVRSDHPPGAELFRVDVSDSAPRAEPIPLAGAVVRHSLLPQGRTAGFGYGTFGGSPAGSALLVSTSTADDCEYTGRGCETARFVVELAGERRTFELEARWLQASLDWAVDGSGLLATTQSGLSFVPSGAYRGSFPLAAEAGTVVSPDRWPAE
jgi:hypothetical protein